MLMIRPDNVFFYRFIMIDRDNLAGNDEVENHATDFDERASQDIFGAQTLGSGDRSTSF